MIAATRLVPEEDAAVEIERGEPDHLLAELDGIGESALRYPICPPEVLRAQIDRLINLAGLAHVRLGVIPLDSPLPTITLHGYGILDDIATVEVNHTEIAVSDSEDVDLYNQITARLWDIAVEGDAASVLLGQVLESVPLR